jgi:uncharacterized protein YciI
MFLIKITFTKPLEVVDQYVAAHREFLEVGYQKDFFVVSGPQTPRVGGIVISQLKNREQLEHLMAQDPYYLNEVAEYEFIEFNPVKFHRDFACFIET